MSRVSLIEMTKFLLLSCFSVLLVLRALKIMFGLACVAFFGLCGNTQEYKMQISADD